MFTEYEYTSSEVRVNEQHRRKSTCLPSTSIRAVKYELTSNISTEKYMFTEYVYTSNEVRVNEQHIDGKVHVIEYEYTNNEVRVNEQHIDGKVHVYRVRVYEQ